MMRVAIDVSALSQGLTSGTAVYLYRLVEALAALPADLDVTLLYNGLPGVGAELTASLEGPRVRALRAWLRWRPLPAPLFWRPFPRRLAAAARSADVFHVGEFVYPRPRYGQAVVATVHDVTTRLFPRWHNLPNRVLHWRRLRWIRRYATRVLIDAEATRQHTATAIGLPAEQLDVVPLAAGTRSAAPGDDAVRDIRRRFGLGQSPYVLSVGTLEPRKNLTRLVKAFAELSSEYADVRLVLAGTWGWRTGALRRAIRSPGAVGRVVVTGPLPERALVALYAGAAVFAYPSLYEGFGLPVLEAMAAGVPVVTSRGGALEEVAGGAALLVDPESASDIAAAVRCLLSDPSARDRLRELGHRRESEFTWRRTAERTLAVYARSVDEARLA